MIANVINIYPEGVRNCNAGYITTAQQESSKTYKAQQHYNVPNQLKSHTCVAEKNDLKGNVWGELQDF